MVAGSVITPPSVSVRLAGGGTKSRSNGSTSGCGETQDRELDGPPSVHAPPQAHVRNPCSFIRLTASTRLSVAKTGGSQATGVSTLEPRMAVGPAYSVTKALPLATGLSTARLTSSL